MTRVFFVGMIDMVISGDPTIASLIRILAESETWRTVSDWPEYEVSSWGNVRRGVRLLQPSLNFGYQRVSLSCSTIIKNYSVHRLVAFAFLGGPPFDGAIIAHNDGIRTNNRIDNIRWASARENQTDRNRHGTKTRGSKVHGAKLRENQIPLIRERLSRGLLLQDIADEFGVSKSTIHLIDKGRIWQHVGGAAWRTEV